MECETAREITRTQKIATNKTKRSATHSGWGCPKKEAKYVCCGMRVELPGGRVWETHSATQTRIEHCFFLHETPTIINRIYSVLFVLIKTRNKAFFSLLCLLEFNNFFLLSSGLVPILPNKNSNQNHCFVWSRINKTRINSSTNTWTLDWLEIHRFRSNFLFFFIFIK